MRNEESILFKNEVFPSFLNKEILIQEIRNPEDPGYLNIN